MHVGNLKSMGVVPSTSISASSTASLELYLEWHREKSVRRVSYFSWMTEASSSSDGVASFVVCLTFSHSLLILCVCQKIFQALYFTLFEKQYN